MEKSFKFMYRYKMEASIVNLLNCSTDLFYMIQSLVNKWSELKINSY